MNIFQFLILKGRGKIGGAHKKGHKARKKRERMNRKVGRR